MKTWETTVIYLDGKKEVYTAEHVTTERRQWRIDLKENDDFILVPMVHVRSVRLKAL